MRRRAGREKGSWKKNRKNLVASQYSFLLQGIKWYHSQPKGISRSPGFDEPILGRWIASMDAVSRASGVGGGGGMAEEDS